MVWTVDVMRDAYEELGIQASVLRPVLTYLDELSYHLDWAGFEPSTETELATSHLEALLDGGNGVQSEAISIERKWRTAPGFLLEPAIEHATQPKPDLCDALRLCVRLLDADLQVVRWVPPIKMRDTQDRLARALRVDLPSILSEYEPDPLPLFKPRSEPRAIQPLTHVQAGEEPGDTPPSEQAAHRTSRERSLPPAARQGPRDDRILEGAVHIGVATAYWVGLILVVLIAFRVAAVVFVVTAAAFVVGGVVGYMYLRFGRSE